MVWRERAADCAPVRPGTAGRADGDLHRRARFASPRARRRDGRTASHRAGGQHDPRRNGRARGAQQCCGDRRDQSAEPDRPGAASPGTVRRADLCRRARCRRARADFGDPREGDAAGRRCRSEGVGRADHALYRRGSGGPDPACGAGGVAARTGVGRSDDGRFRICADRDAGVGDRRDADRL